MASQAQFFVQWSFLMEHMTALNEVGDVRRNLYFRGHLPVGFQKCLRTALIDARGTRACQRLPVEASAIFAKGENNKLQQRRQVY